MSGGGPLWAASDPQETAAVRGEHRQLQEVGHGLLVCCRPHRADRFVAAGKSEYDY